MFMADIDKINDFIQSYLKKNGLRKITPVEMAPHLENAKLLNNSKIHPGYQLRGLCRNKEIHRSSKPNGTNWIIEYDPGYKSRSSNIMPATIQQAQSQCNLKVESSIKNNNHCESLDAYVPKDPHILVLGTMPGKESLRLQQYYANRGNRFWKIIAKAAEKPLPTVYSDRLELLNQLHIALWDVYGSAEREGSLDSNIKNGTPNDIRSLVESNPSIKKILFNGGKAYKKALDYSCVNVKMPSTSSANTRFTQEELFSRWLKEIKEG